MSEWHTDPAAGGRRRRRMQVAVVVAALVAGGVLLANQGAGGRDGAGQLRVDTGQEQPPSAGLHGQGEWRVLPDAPLSARHGHVAVWTGAEMIVWGGEGVDKPFNDGAAYDPATDRWRRLPRNGGVQDGTRPSEVAAVWTGRDMVVLGPAGGWAYRPDDDKWRDVPPPPRGPWLPRSIGWTGEEVVVLADGQHRAVGYDPDADTWRELPEPPVSGRADGSSVELLGSLVVLGTSDGAPAIARYDPIEDAWGQAAPAPMAGAGGPGAWSPQVTADPAGGRVLVAATARDAEAPALWTWSPEDGWRTHTDLSDSLDGRPVDVFRAGDALVGWVGESPDTSALRPSFSTRWRDIARSPLSARQDAPAVWTGEELLVWGGRSGDEALGDGAAFRPDADARRPAPAAPEEEASLAGTWRRLPPGPVRSDAPPPRPPQVAWTGERVLVIDEPTLTRIAVYDPVGVVWRAGARGPREQRRVAHTTVWAGEELVVITAYGSGPARPLDGVAYDPEARTWRDLDSAPVQATGPLMATWTGQEVVVLAGAEFEQPTALAYEPARDRWRILDAPPLTSYPAALAWTGEEVLALSAGGRDHLARLDLDTGVWQQGADSPVAPHTLYRYATPSGWTGSEWVVHGGAGGPGVSPDAAVYDPATDTWRVVDKPPQHVEAAVSTGWDTHPLLVVGPENRRDDDAPLVARLYDAAADEWRTLPPMPPWLWPVAAVWTGEQLLVWGGRSGEAAAFTPRGAVGTG